MEKALKEDESEPSPYSDTSRPSLQEHLEHSHHSTVNSSLCWERLLAHTLHKYKKGCPAIPVVCRYCGARLRDISLDPDPEEYTIIRNKYRCGYC